MGRSILNGYNPSEVTTASLSMVPMLFCSIWPQIFAITDHISESTDLILWKNDKDIPEGKVQLINLLGKLQWSYSKINFVYFTT